jgi:hypothetical protein
MRRSILFSLGCAILLITCARVTAQEMVPSQDDRQAAQVKAQQYDRQVAQLKAQIEKSLDKLRIELKAATSGVLGPVVTGAPYSGVTINESIQTLADGNRIVQRSAYNVARDGQGRVRREELDEAGTVMSVMIMDPVGNASYVLDPASRTAKKVALLKDTVSFQMDWKQGLTPATEKATTVPLDEIKSKVVARDITVYGGGAGAVVVGAKTVDYRKESLGTQSFDGVTAEGTRTVATIPAGDIGNERPIEMISEQWYSKDLQMTVMSRHSDPRTGETTYRVTNIRRGEPDPSLFQVPADYTVTAPMEVREKRN